LQGQGYGPDEEGSPGEGEYIEILLACGIFRTSGSTCASNPG